MSKSKNDLIIETIASIGGEEKMLLKRSDRTLGDIIDNCFDNKTRAFVELMTKLYEIYDELEEEDMKESGLANLLRSDDLYEKSGSLSDLIKSVGEDKIKAVVATSQIDYSNLLKDVTLPVVVRYK